MTETTTATESELITNLWETLPDQDRSVVPRGEVIFQGSQVVGIEVSEHLWQLTMTFPRNFVYRMEELWVWGADVSGAAFGSGGFQRAMKAVVTTDNPDELPYSFLLYNALQATEDVLSFTFDFNGNPPEVGAMFTPMQGIPAGLINAGKGTAKIVINWYAGSNATAPTMEWRCRASMYDIQQQKRWQINTPIPVRSI